MRSWMAFLVAGLVACGSSAEDKSLSGQMPPEASAVYAIDTQGRRVDGAVDGGSFTLALTPGNPVIVVFEADGLPYVLQFAKDASGTTETVIPDYSGDLDLGVVALRGAAFRDGTAEEWAESENNPLDDVDTDDDGESDFEDDDDDDDGDHDDDDDDDGDGEDDDDQDLDSDDDGDPDCHDDDDDGDGIGDEEDDDGGDSDDDGVPDDEDHDDDNDGEEDDDSGDDDDESTDD